jgi:glycogen debranching enzyme
VDQLKADSQTLGKPAWQPMLRYVAELHERSTHPPRAPFPHPWEEIGPGYCYGPAFGHWDIVHAVLDVMASEPQHAADQLLNNLAAQEQDGLVPGVIWMRESTARWSNEVGHPPLWPVAVQEYAAQTGSDALIARCFDPLVRQIGWFEAQRQTADGGFFYTDILTRRWESGIDEGIRFHEVQAGPFACVDATSHVYQLYETAAAWAERIGAPSGDLRRKASRVREFIQTELFDTQTGFFHDVWALSDSTKRRLAFEGM